MGQHIKQDEIIEISVKHALIYNFENHNAANKFLPHAEICTVTKKTLRRLGRIIRTIAVENDEILLHSAAA